MTASLERKRLRDLERLRVIQLQQEKQLLEIEKEKSERLLLNILPQPIAERLKGGERNIAERFAEVTVLFADIKGFSVFCKKADALQIQRVLRDYLTAMTVIIRDHGNTLDKYMGDGIMGAMLDARIVATTNAQTEDLDPAIVRPGRLCRRIDIGELCYEQACEVYERLVGSKPSRS